MGFSPGPGQGGARKRKEERRKKKAWLVKCGFVSLFHWGGKRRGKVVNQAYPKICVNGIISHDVVYQYDVPVCVFEGNNVNPNC